MVKAEKFFGILVFFTLCIVTNTGINNSFPENQSFSNLNASNAKEQQQQTVNQSFINTNLEKLKHNFFYIKTNDLLVPVNFLTPEDNILNSIVYDDDQNALFILLNPLPSNGTNLLIQIPRYILDSKTPENKDNNFTVLIDDKPSKYTEITSKNESGNISRSSSAAAAAADYNSIDNTFSDSPNRKLLIDFQKDAKVIKIEGTDLSKTQNQTQMDVQVDNGEKEKYQRFFSISTENINGYIKFSENGGNLKDINLKQNTVNNKTLELFIIPFEESGNLLIQIPRYILDSKTPENKDNNFTVLIDDKPSKYTEITSKNESGNISRSSSAAAAAADYNSIDNTFSDSPNRKLLIDFQKDAKVIKIEGTDLSKTQNQTQNQNAHLSITILVISAIIGISSSAAIIYILYKKGKIRFVDIFKYNRNKQGNNR